MKPVTGKPTNVCAPATTAPTIGNLWPATLFKPPAGLCERAPVKVIRAHPFEKLLLGKLTATVLIEPSTPDTDPVALVGPPLRMLTTVDSKHSGGVLGGVPAGEIDVVDPVFSSRFQKENKDGSHAPAVVMLLLNGLREEIPLKKSRLPGKVNTQSVFDAVLASRANQPWSCRCPDPMCPDTRWRWPAQGSVPGWLGSGTGAASSGPGSSPR